MLTSFVNERCLLYLELVARLCCDVSVQGRGEILEEVFKNRLLNNLDWINDMAHEIIK